MYLSEALRRYLGGTKPGAGLTQKQTADGLMLSIWEGGVYTMAVSLIGGQFLAGFALVLGAGPRGVAVAAALPPLSGAVQVALAPMIAARWRRVPVLAVSAALHRIGWGLAGFLPLALAPTWRFPAYAAALFLTHAAQSASVPAWWSLMSDLIEARKRGRYFGLRNAVVAGAAVVAILAAGTLLDRVPGLPGFLILHGAVAVIGVLNVRMVAAHPEPQRRPESTAPAMTPLANRAFRLIAGFVAVWTLAQSLSTPLYSIILLREMRLPYVAISWLMVTVAIASTLFLFIWGPLCDRIGEGRLISWLAPAAASVPLGWLFVGQGGLPLLTLLNVTQGATTAGITLALGNINLAVAGDGHERAPYLAMFSAVVGVAGGVGPLLGGLIGVPGFAFVVGGASGWLLCGIWWFWYRPRHLISTARRRWELP